MAQQQNNLDRFAGPSMIQDNDHCAGIPQVQDGNAQAARQVDQSQRPNRQQGGERRRAEFVYENPRQVS